MDPDIWWFGEGCFVFFFVGVACWSGVGKGWDRRDGEASRGDASHVLFIRVDGCTFIV